MTPGPYIMIGCFIKIAGAIWVNNEHLVQRPEVILPRKREVKVKLSGKISLDANDTGTARRFILKRNHKDIGS